MNSLVMQTAEPSGTNCAFGGLRFDSGLDTSEDGALQSTEIDETGYVCGATLGTNGFGGYYGTSSVDERTNALLACESYHGFGNCCNDGCGSCNDHGYHLCGAPNCNGSVYWNYDNDDQGMGCNWQDPAEILVNTDGINWVQ